MPRKYQNPKLQVRTEGKRPYYFIRVRVPVLTPDGRKIVRQSKLLGFVGQISQKEAQKRRANILEVLNAGRILVESQVRFKDVVERFLAVRVPQLGAAAQAKYRGQIARHILPAFGKLRMCEIDAPAVEEWLTGKAATLSWWSRIDLKGILSAIFTAASGWKLWSGDNPTKGVRIGRKIPAREKRLLTAEQLRMILGSVCEDTRLIILIAALTGLRISEIMGLRWRDIDLEAGTLTVRRRWYRGDLDEPKTEASKRTRALGPLADELVRRHSSIKCSQDWLFIGDANNPPDERDILRYELRPALKRLGIYAPGMGWHALRRMHVSMLQSAAGATPIEAQKAAGHTSLDLTLLYSLTDRERDAQQVARLGEHLIGPVTGRPV